MQAHDTRSSLLMRLRATAANTSLEQAAAWEEFVRIYAPQVLQWCRARGLQETDAGELCQDVLVRFWKQSANFEYDPKRRFRGYLRQILNSALAGWAASRKTEAPAAGSDAEARLDSLQAREDLIQRIETAYDTELLAIAIEDVKTRVKPHTWRAFEIVAIEMQPGSAICEELGISPDSVYAARRNVQKMLKETVARLEGGGRNT
jgi:RNA polymerase sigma-70 factor (ECF subfamily)